ncbi:Conserved oligomeric Golgi complex subunit 5 [Spathaspora sp. JA1]|nr:Conserved oligomeric Golgi complex subunit 5 [Spathaspora sp. JA1]
MTTASSNVFEDFEAFLEPDFDPIHFANELLLGTNGSDNIELDLATPIKKLRFDIDECNKRMSSIASTNYEDLVTNFSTIENVQSILSGHINPQLERINAPFNRIKQEIIEPFDEAVKLNNALKRIHQTLNLLRSASFFIVLVQQLEELEQGDTFSVDDSHGDVVRLARLHLQIKQLYQSASGEDTSTHILSVKLIRDYQSIEISRRSTLINLCSQLINNEFSHSTSLQSSNRKLNNNLQALYILDPAEFFSVFDKATISRQMTINVNLLSRALQSPRNFTTIMKEVKDTSSEYFDKLNTIISSWKMEDEHTMLNVILSHYKVELLYALFWSKLNHKFKKNIASTMARGGPIAKNLKVYYEGLKNAVQEMFSNEYEKRLILDSLSVINR